VDSRGVRRRMWTGRGSLKLADVAVELCPRDPTAAADVYGTQIAALHERVHRRAADPEDLRRLLGGEEEPTGGHDVAERLRITHVGLSRIDRAFLRDGCHATVGQRSSEHLQYVPRRTHVRLNLPTGGLSGSRRYCRSTGGARSVRERGAGEARSSPVRRQYGLHRPRDRGQVAVVDPPVVQLAGELAEQPGPVAAGGHERHPDFDAPLDELHRGQTGGSGPGLLPRPVPAGGGAPLRDRPQPSRRDQCTAPPACRRRGPPFGTVPVRCGPVRAGLRGCPRGLLTPLPLALPLSGSGFGGAAGSHAVKAANESPVTRHHESADPRMHEV
jgi:hypothetical protein